jgi:hypothetical protein
LAGLWLLPVPNGESAINAEDEIYRIALITLDWALYTYYCQKKGASPLPFNPFPVPSNESIDLSRSSKRGN